MRHLAFAIMSLLMTAPAFADTRPIVVLLDQMGGSFDFDLDTWRTATDKRRDALAGYRSGVTPKNLAEAQARAKEKGATVLTLTTANIPAKDSRAFQAEMRRLEDTFGQNATMSTWEVIARFPHCVLIDQGTPLVDGGDAGLVVVMDDAAAKASCYDLAIAYWAQTTPRKTPVYFDAVAFSMQELMGPPRVAEAYLALKDQRDDRGRYLKRPSSVYAPREEIFLRAYLDRMGRHDVGMMDSHFEFSITMVVRDAKGTEIARQTLHTYRGPSTLIFPIDQTYFWNDITAGVFLVDSGDYDLTFEFQDLTRPQVAPAAVSFPVRVE